MKRNVSQFAVCVDNREYPASLELRKLYQVVPDPVAAKLHQIRVVDEFGEDYLHPTKYFVAVSLSPSTKKAVPQAEGLAAAR